MIDETCSEIFYNISKVVLNEKDPHELIRKIMDLCQEQVGVHCGVAYEIVEDRISLVWHKNLSEEAYTFLSGANLYSEYFPIFEKMLKHRKPQVMETDTHPLFARGRFRKAKNITHIVSVPLMYHDELYGIIAFTVKDDENLDAIVKKMEILSTVISLGIMRIKEYEKLERRAEELEKRTEELMAKLEIKPTLESGLLVEEAGKHHLEPGEVYLIEKKGMDATMRVFTDLLAQGWAGLCITRKNPKRLRERYSLRKTPIVCLTTREVEGEMTIAPSKLERIAGTILRFIDMAEKGVVCFSGIEALLTENGFENVMRLLSHVQDHIMVSNSCMIITIDPKVLDEKERHILEADRVTLSPSRDTAVRF